MARYTTEQKEAVINRAREIGAAAAAKAEGVSYPTVLKWMKESGAAAGVPEEMQAECRNRLSEDMIEVLDRFENWALEKV